MFSSRDLTTETESGSKTPMEPDLFPPRGVRTGQGQDWTSRGEESQRAGDDESVEMLLVLTVETDTCYIVEPDCLYLACR